MINLQDSDFDEDDEDNQGEIDEMFSISPQHSDDFDQDEVDSDDIDTHEFKLSQKFSFAVDKSRSAQVHQCRHNKNQTCQQCAFFDNNAINKLFEKESSKQYSHWESIDLPTLS